MNCYKQLNTLMLAVPKSINCQTGQRKRRKVITAIAIWIMAILATKAAAAVIALSA
jgi:hypothetical protein